MWYLRKTGKNVFHWSFVYKRSFNSTKQRVFWNSCFFLQPRPWKCTKNGEKGLPDLHWCPYKDTYWHLNVCCYLNFDIYLCNLPILNVAFQGKRFVKQNISRLTKNHRGDTADSDDKSPRMYEEPGNERCPVNSFENTWPNYIPLISGSGRNHARVLRRKTAYVTYRSAKTHLGTWCKKSVRRPISAKCTLITV